MRLERGRLLAVVAVVERGGAGLEQRVVVLRVGGGDDEQVVLQPEPGADVPLLGDVTSTYATELNPCARADTAGTSSAIAAVIASSAVRKCRRTRLTM